MNRTRVLQLITSLGAGGAERLLLNMMSHFDHNRFDVRLATLADDLNGLYIYGYSPRSDELIHARPGAPLRTMASLASFYRRFDPHVVHAHMFHPLVAGLALTRQKRSPAPLCFTSHCDEHGYGGMRRRVVKASRRLRAADIVFASDQHPDFNAARTLVISNGVEVPPARFERRAWTVDGPIRLLTVGRITEQKDPLGLLRSFAELRPEVTLDVVGTGPLEAAARELATALGLDGRVRFHGVRSDIRELMRASDVFVMHSRFEGMPMVLLEAGAEGMPVLATPVGSIPSVLGSDRGLVTTADAFTKNLTKLLEAPDVAIDMGKRLYDHVLANHSIQRTTAEHEALYLDLAGNRS